MYQVGQKVVITYDKWEDEGEPWGKGSHVTLTRRGTSDTWWYASDRNGSEGLLRESEFAPAHPIRTVTRREVVAGTYGPLEVGAVINIPDCERPDDQPPVTVDLSLDDSLTADEIDTLVQHLTAIAEALRES